MFIPLPLLKTKMCYLSSGDVVFLTDRLSYVNLFPQTEDERELRMQILQGRPKDDKSEGKSNKKDDSGKKSKSGNQQKQQRQNVPKENRPKPVDPENPDEPVKEVEPANDEVDMLDALVCKSLNDYCTVCQGFRLRKQD